MQKKYFYLSSYDKIIHYTNKWDWLLLTIILLVLCFLGWSSQQMAVPYKLGMSLPISLDPYNLPGYALRTALRLLIALLLSLIFSFIIGALAAKNKRAEQIIVPALDILQSIPVLSFLSIFITGFISIFPNSLLGPECAAIFAIFTSQVWNITFSFYQSLKNIPHDLKEAAAVFQLSAWQCFWKIEVPCSIPNLLWNMMMSMSASWFFVVLSESISVSNQIINLPGIGSYIAMAIKYHNLNAVGYAILTMLIVIITYDQILFRPLIAWSEKFKFDPALDEDEYQSWLLDWIRNGRLMQHCGDFLRNIGDKIFNMRRAKSMAVLMIPFKKIKITANSSNHKIWDLCFWGLLIGGITILIKFILNSLTLQDILQTIWLGAITGMRVVMMLVLSSMLWIPIGVGIGLRPRLARKIQPIIQCAAAFPANLFYPLFVIAIVRFQANSEIWLAPLMILGTQWYILFNVISGSMHIPRELYLAANNFGLKGWLWWKRLALPGIFPFYITGAIAAAGGAWNASIVAECVSWGHTTVRATGLGAYIQASAAAGDFPKIALGTAVMCIYVLIFNRLIWQPLYRLAAERFSDA